ncbi:hypothetical protein ACVWWG_009012 [Bradyrhizobium sp. LB7.2]
MRHRLNREDVRDFRKVTEASRNSSPGRARISRQTTAQGRPDVRLPCFSPVHCVCNVLARELCGVPAGTRPSLRPFSGKGVKTESKPRAEYAARRRRRVCCLTIESKLVEVALVPRTQRSASSAVRCRAGAYPAALYRTAFWVPALRSNARALQRVRDTRAVRPHRPVQIGLRFSPNAFSPSLASSVMASSAIWLSV